MSGINLSSGKLKKKKGLGGKKPLSKQQYNKTLAYFQQKGVPLGFIEDSIIGKLDKYVTESEGRVTKTTDQIVRELGGYKRGMGYKTQMRNLKTGERETHYREIVENPRFNRNQKPGAFNQQYMRKVRPIGDSKKAPAGKVV